MSEIPRSNPRLENFEANKAAAEAAENARNQAKFESEIYGEAGQGDNPENYTDESLKRIEEADAYERHMEAMAERPTYRNGSVEDFYAFHDQAANDVSRGYNLEVEDAYAENDAFDERIRAEGEALDRKLSTDPALRFMDNISREIAELNATKVDEDTDEEAINARIAHLEEVLNVRLERYEASEGFDPAIADYLMDRDDAGARKKAAVKALADLEHKADSKSDVDPVTGKLKTAEGDDVDPTTGKLKSAEGGESDDDVEVTGGKLKSAEDDEDVDPVTGKLKSAETDDDDEDVEPTTGELKRADDGELEDEEDEPEAEKKKWYKRLGARVYKIFTYETEGGERKFSGKRLAIATGGVAVLGVLLYFSLRSGTDNSHLMPKGGPKGGGSPIDAAPAVPVSPTEVVPSVDLPPSTGFEYPWDWAVKAFGKAEAMDTLRELAGKAVEDGKDVQITGSGTHQVISVNGNTNTEYVVNALRGYYTK